jgi:hypothetical protein
MESGCCPRLIRDRPANLSLRSLEAGKRVRDIKVMRIRLLRGADPPVGCSPMRIPLCLRNYFGMRGWATEGSPGRGRDSDYSPPPAQTRAGAANAHGSYLGCWDA